MDKLPREAIKDEICDEVGLGDPVKCGEVFFLQTEQLVLICGYCQESYQNINEFGVHVRDKHLNHRQITDDNNYRTIKQESMECVEDDPFHSDEDENQKTVNKNPGNTSDVYYFDEEYETQQTINRNLGNISKDIETDTKRQLKQPPVDTQTLLFKDFYCSTCKKKYIRRAAFHAHNEKVHGIPQPCEFCFKSFASFEEQEEHKSVHMSARFHEAIHSCDRCGCRFTNEKVKKTHMLICGAKSIRRRGELHLAEKRTNV